MGAERRVILNEEVDFANTARTSRLLADAIDDVAVSTVVVDCRGVTFVDSWGIRDLVRAKQQLDAQGRRFAIENLPPSVRRVIEVTQLIEFLNVRP